MNSASTSKPGSHWDSPPEQAMAPHMRRAVTVALLPAIDSTKVVGLIALPGAMTGLILAGVEPIVAVRYQIVVMYMLLAAASVSAIVASHLSRRALFDGGRSAIPGAGSLINAQVGIPGSCSGLRRPRRQRHGDRRAQSAVPARGRLAARQGGGQVSGPASSPRANPARRARHRRRHRTHPRRRSRPRRSAVIAAAGNSGASRHTRVVGRSCATLPPRAAMWGRSDDVGLRCKR